MTMSFDAGTIFQRFMEAQKDAHERYEATIKAAWHAYLEETEPAWQECYVQLREGSEAIRAGAERIADTREREFGPGEFQPTGGDDAQG